MDWDRNRRFEDHRGGESYRPGSSRGYGRRSRSPPRLHSPPSRLVADTWVPSTGRSFGRPRSRSPPPFRRRSRSPQPYNRDAGIASYTKSYSSRRFSPRRDGRPRSPISMTRRPRSPDRLHDIGWGQGTSASRHPREQSFGRDYAYSRKERRLPPDSRHIRPGSPSRRMPSLEADMRPTTTPRTRSPIGGGNRVLAPERYSGQRRRSHTPNDSTLTRPSAPGSIPTSRRSSPLPDKPSIPPRGNMSRSPPASILHRHRSRDSGLFLGRDRTPSTKGSLNTPDEPSRSPTAEQGFGRLPPNQDDAGPLRALESQGRTSYTKVSCPSNAPSQPKAFSRNGNHWPPATGPPHGPKTLPSHPRASNISLLSAPTKPRGSSSFKDNGWPGAPIRRGVSIISGSHGTPTGPRSNQVPALASESPRPRSYGQSGLSAASPFQTSRHSKYLIGLNTVIAGGKLLPSGFITSTERRISQLDTDKDRLLTQIAESQRLKRAGLRDWDRLDRESTICALKSELAEGHLQSITHTEGAFGKALF